MQLLPGFNSAPDIPPPPPPPPKVDDPEVLEARRRQRDAELRRKGRASTILTGSQGAMGAANIDQPQAGALLLG